MGLIQYVETDCIHTIYHANVSGRLLYTRPQVEAPRRETKGLDTNDGDVLKKEMREGGQGGQGGLEVSGLREIK